MAVEPSRSLDQLFSEALARKDPAVRRQFLREACEQDGDLFEEINQLLAAREDARDFLGGEGFWRRGPIRRL